MMPSLKKRAFLMCLVACVVLLASWIAGEVAIGQYALGRASIFNVRLLGRVGVIASDVGLGALLVFSVCQCLEKRRVALTSPQDSKRL
ncbi:MAG: hypothetical protein ACN6OP_15015 [Pseudomonadales bacterium]